MEPYTFVLSPFQVLNLSGRKAAKSQRKNEQGIWWETGERG